jgi:hypothetical protein
MRSTRFARSAAGRRDQVSICGTHLPKIKRPISSPGCFTSSGSAAARKRSATAKNAFSFSLCASRPCSTSSTSTRLSLRRLFLAILSTCSASRVGKVTLLRTCFVDAISPVYTVMVHPRRGPHGRLYYNKRMTEGTEMPLDSERPSPLASLAGGTCTFHPLSVAFGPPR